MAKNELSPSFNQELAPYAETQFMKISNTRIVDVTPTKNGGTLRREFYFAEREPTVVGRLTEDGAASYTELGSVPLKDFDLKTSAQAYIKLLQMGGSPFGLRNSK